MMTKEQAVKEAVRLSEAPGKASTEGAEGRVDFAQVKNWRAGQNQDLGSLEVEGFVPGQQEGRDLPFYNELAYSSIQHQKTGQIEDLMYNEFEVPAVRKDGASLSFKLELYTQYLVDLQAQHHALEGAIAEALAFHKEPSPLRSALECFSEAQGLDRSLEIAADLTNLDSAASSSGREAPSVSPAAASYVARLNSIGQDCLADSADGRKACLKLMTHAFCIQFVLLTQGSKCGAAFAEKLNLFKKKAVNMYRRYPEDKCGKDPFVALRNNTNEAGGFLTPEERLEMRWEMGSGLAHNIQTTATLSE